MHKRKLEQCLRPVPRSESFETLSRVFLSLCAEIDSIISIKARLLFEGREWAQLVNIDIDVRSYANSQKFADDYLIAKFLSKFKDFSHEDLNPKAEAIKSFNDSEDQCLETNNRFKLYERDPSKWDPKMLALLLQARRKISYVLGRPDLSRISAGFGWGPGATTSVSGNRTSAYVKFKAKLDVTSNALIMGHCCINSTPAWANCQIQSDNFPSLGLSLTRDIFNVIRGNEVILVPKNAKTFRTIAKEPHVNSYLQRGFGRFFRERLRSHAGIDLLDQSMNQRLAREGSISGSFSTIDLKAASDTISTEVVKFLLPNDWFLLLDSIRSKQGFMRDKDYWFYYQKFSSAGNGFTFELESLIFWALSSSAIESDSSRNSTMNVYGDDIIVPCSSYADVSELLSYCGFTINEKKSFSSGPFRESCGADYFNGTSVRPIFLKENLSNVQTIYKLANSIRRYSHRRNFNYGCDKRFLSIWSTLFNGVHPDFRNLTIPDGLGDSGFIMNLDESNFRRTSHKDGVEGYFCKHLVHTPVKENMKDSHAGYTSKLYESGSEMPSLNFHSLRKMTIPRIATVHVHEWYDLGPWC